MSTDCTSQEIDTSHDRGRTLPPSTTSMDDSISGLSWNNPNQVINHPSHSPDPTRRKRLSFFGRSTSDASKRFQPTPAAAMFDRTSHSPDPYVRPSSRSDARKRAADQFDNIRKSLFRRKHSHIVEKGDTSRPTSRDSLASSTLSRAQSPDMSKVNIGLIPFVPGTMPPKTESPNQGEGIFNSATECRNPSL